MSDNKNVIMIYSDPFTCKIPEGAAEIVKFIDVVPHGLFSYIFHFRVKFIDVDDDGIYYRTVVFNEAK